MTTNFVTIHFKSITQHLTTKTGKKLCQLECMQMNWDNSPTWIGNSDQPQYIYLTTTEELASKLAEDCVYKANLSGFFILNIML